LSPLVWGHLSTDEQKQKEVLSPKDGGLIKKPSLERYEKSSGGQRERDSTNTSLAASVGGRYDPASREVGPMNRRAFVTGLGAVLAAPLAGEAQQAEVPCYHGATICYPFMLKWPMTGAGRPGESRRRLATS
jgi:hypothetical protein